MKKTRSIGLFVALIAISIVLSGCTQNQSGIKKQEMSPSSPEASKGANAKKEVPASSETVAVDAPKSEKPEVEVFIMSYCPFGTQMQKGIAPVMETLGDKADISIKWVDYIMHGEKETNENLNQYCIQKEEPEKYLGYMNCFLKEGEAKKCLTSESVNSNKIEICIASAKTEFATDEGTEAGARYPAFDVNKKENDQYGVKGSPTLVVNGQMVKANRDSASLLKTICSAFENQPEECRKSLSSMPPSPGFGEGAGASSSGGCGG